MCGWPGVSAQSSQGTLVSRVSRSMLLDRISLFLSMIYVDLDLLRGPSSRERPAGPFTGH